MKTKILGSFLLAAFLLVVAVSGVMALGFSASLSPAVLLKNVNTTVFTITNTETATPVNFSVTVPSTISDGTHTVSLSTVGSTTFQLNPNNSTTINFSATAIPTDLYLGSYSSNIVVNAMNASNSSENSSQTVPLTFIKGYCSAGSSTNSTRYLQIISIKDQTSESDWEWKPADDVDVQVKVEYTNDADSDDEIEAVIKVDLYDSQTHTFVDLDNSDDLERSVTLAEGDSVSETFTINVPTSDVEDSSGRYKLYVKVYEDGKETTLCRDNLGSGSTSSVTDSDYYKSVDINRNSYEVILKNLELSSADATCNEEVTITAEVLNIGTNDEDKVYVRLFNSELKLEENSTVFSLDEGDSKRISMSFIVPQNATMKSYDIMLATYYKYSDSSDEYRDFTEEPYKQTIKVQNCRVNLQNASITAALSDSTPNAVIGGQVVLETTITNNGNSSTTYTVSVLDNSAWSTAKVDPATFTLNAGESKKVSITLDINSDAEVGDKDFSIKAAYGTSSTQQKVRLTLEKGFTAQAFVNHLKNNWFIYTVIIVNLILIIAIIAIVSRMVSRRKRED